MVEWLSCLAHTTKVLCSSLGTTKLRMILDQSLTVICLGAPVRYHADYFVTYTSPFG